MGKTLRENRILLAALITSLAALLFTLLVKIVDVQAIGPEGSSVGFAALNGAFASAHEYAGGWYLLSKLLGALAILIILGFAAIGFLELLQKKNLWKVHREILDLGGLYLATLAVYLFFEIVVINYRPVLDDGELAASFPSSHTVLACVVFLSAAHVLPQLFPALSEYRRWILIGGAGLSFLTVLSRLFSGVHWLTDIFGGLFYSAALLFWYLTLTSDKKKVREEEAEE